MDKIEIVNITDSPQVHFVNWLKKQLSVLWSISIDDVDDAVKKNFDNEQRRQLFNVVDRDTFSLVDELVFTDQDTLITAWYKTSERPFLEWARMNGLDVFPRIMVGRIFKNKPEDYIEHELPSDYITSQLVRSFPATLKELLQWNGFTNFDELIRSHSIRLYLKNPPSLKAWEPEYNSNFISEHGERLYCLSPFKDLILINDGSHFCCSAWHGYPSLGDPKSNSLDDIWNSESAIEFRQSILDGSYRYCRHDMCPRLVNPKRELTTLSELTPGLQHEIQQTNGDLLGKFTFVNYGFDPSCNLSCPSCRTEVIIAKGKAAEDIKFIEAQLEQNGHDLEELYISGGGDAFGSPYSRDFLSRMTEENFPNLHSILIHCNGQLFNGFIWNKLPDFVKDRIHYVEISIDAARKETYEENRRGGSFEKLLDNLEFIKSLKKKGYLSYIKFSFVVQDNNVSEMGDFVEIAKLFDADCVFFCRLMNWGAYSNVEYKNRNVCDKSHLNHQQLLSMLADSRMDESIVDLTNLSGLKGE
ncbi:radical SAM protein [Photobacterium leiognathi]|uniref:radical SAM protein n=1 Tax=Photobacterium leiognathi TaxID=553611 RepID=UPI0029812556|nr:radical SAM protein [Photobacterium leiognathi]